ncbi:MAG: ribonuclease III [Coriobacteriia bacterium]|nr:ribonuclease III [Coriobacteriia bacterium]MBN2840407.1 ribonuclease III [Coriobacteriia bacterium]
MNDELPDRAEQVLGYRFSDARLLATALTHPSYAAEHAGAEAYDRLEFLGDAVLGFIVADEMFRAFPHEPEGDLTRRKHSVVSGEALTPVAIALGIGELLRLGRGADAAGERERASVLENALEALVGAVYLDGGLPAARDLVARFRAALPARRTSAAGDVKSLLQQRTQTGGGSLPEYRVVGMDGPPHARTFTAEVWIGERLMGTGSGRSKQAAEKTAAAAALKVLEEADPGV